MTIYVCEVIAKEVVKSSTTRGPPQAFIPIPNKTELGGCARSDSLVRLLIFWRAVPPVQFML
ncbi:MAG: hypothetical protein MUE44_22280 [Oscillatoriaceae cyanobacterium Prado104]|nr:hypothetical protein [Oscillatoriaceae cyanobacterium Prado104]